MEDQIKEYLKRLDQDSVDFMQLQFTDLAGFVKTVSVPRNRFASALEEGVVF